MITAGAALISASTTAIATGTMVGFATWCGYESSYA